MSIIIFPYFFNRFCPDWWWKSVGLLHIAYAVIHLSLRNLNVKQSTETDDLLSSMINDVIQEIAGPTSYIIISQKWSCTKTVEKKSK